MNPLISVIIPAFNAEAHIQVAVNSVICQSYPNLEIIVIDDGSADRTRLFADQLASSDSRVRCYSIKNSGRAAARNYGISKALGNWLAFLDADDFWDREKLSKQLACWHEDNTVGLIYAERIWIDAEGYPISEQPERYDLPVGKILDKLIDGNYICTSTVLVKKDIVESVGGFDEGQSFKNCQDYDLWIRIASKTNAAVVKEPLSYYRLHDKNAHKNILSRYIGLRSCMNRLADVLKEQQSYSEVVQHRLSIRTAQICNQFAINLFKIREFERSAEALKVVADIFGLDLKRKALLFLATSLYVMGFGRIRQ